MKIKADKRLFWFVKEGAELDLDNVSILDMYVQQAITQGSCQDVKELLKRVEPYKLKGSLDRIEHFLPFEVRKFWEDYIGSTLFTSKRNS